MKTVVAGFLKGLLACIAVFGLLQANASELSEALKKSDHVLLMRHALAPGVGVSAQALVGAWGPVSDVLPADSAWAARAAAAARGGAAGGPARRRADPLLDLLPRRRERRTAVEYVGIHGRSLGLGSIGAASRVIEAGNARTAGAGCG